MPMFARIQGFECAAPRLFKAEHASEIDAVVQASKVRTVGYLSFGPINNIVCFL